MIKILNPTDNSIITTLTDVTNPIKYEEINGEYKFSFTTHRQFGITEHLHSPNIIEIENDYFKFARVRRKRGIDGAYYDVYCDHISYLLNVEDVTESTTYSGTPHEILTEILVGTQFLVGLVEFEQAIEFTTSAKTKRGRILALVNYIGGELLYFRNEVSIIIERGEQRGLEFRVGVNIVSVSEELDTTQQDGVRTALEVEPLDLSQFYEELESATIGDTVRTVDEELGIDRTLRIVSIECDLHRKEIPRIQLGNVIRDFSDIVEKNNEEIDKLKEDLEEAFEQIGQTLNDYYMEKGELPYEDGGVNFYFQQVYSEKPNVNADLVGNVTDLYALNKTLLKSGENYVGVNVEVITNGTLNGIEIHLQAVCTGVVQDSTGGGEVEEEDNIFLKKLKPKVYTSGGV